MDIRMHRTALALATGLSLLPVATAQKTLRERSSGLQVSEPDQHDIDLRTTPVVRAVQKAADSVVSIYINRANALPNGETLTEGQGSGVILDDSGFLITNWHVVAPVLLGDGSQVLIKLKDGRARAAKVLSSSPDRDLALLQMQLQGNEKVKPVEIGRSAGLMIGETTIAIGNPQGHANTVTSGVLSAIGRSIKVRAPDGNVRPYSGLLQTDAAINPGNSGGALLDITGKLIGINNAMMQGAENISFAIPVDTVREVFEHELIQSDSFAMSSDAAWLGLSVADQDGAVVVTDVVAEGPAARAGVQRGDVLAAVGDAAVKTSLDYLRRALSATPQQPFPLHLRRGHTPIDVAPVPLSRTQLTILALTGLDLQEITAEDDPTAVQKASRAFSRGLRRPVQLPAVLRVNRVEPRSPAADLQLSTGDVVLAVVGVDAFRRKVDVRLDSTRDFATYLRQNAGGSLELVILRGEQDLVGRLDVRARESRR
jgi:serine protease Do